SWEYCLDNMKQRLETPIRTAIDRSVPIQAEGSKLVIGVHGKFSRDFLNRPKCRKEIASVMPTFDGQALELDFEFVALDEPTPKRKHDSNSKAVAPVKEKNSRSRTSSPLNPRYTFKTFVRGASNNLASGAAIAVAEQPAKAYNPLFIYGGVGLGKTHLLSAIGHAMLETRPNFRLVYLSSEQFMNDYINHVRSNRMEAFRRRYREMCDVFLVDDIQFLAGKAGTQDEFFYTFNALHDLNRQIVVTSDKYPHEIPDLEERLRTRFQWGLIADIQQPELETRVAILQAKADTETIALPNDVALFLAQHIKSNVRELEGSLIRLAAIASLQNSAITVDFAREMLKSFLSPTAATVTIETIQKEVASYFNVKVSDLKGHKRHRAIARPRQIAMFLSRKLTSASFPEIGRRFGGKDHSTVISAYNKINDLIDKDLGIRTTVETIERQLNL
ncbi:MAG: chromosomal replication initiator protein DnaA, partial [Deltaproteobacteria bacterium]|nr:chromosomal replication initiator protein DnaA [Deltaproteobacteria bacterium]